MKEIDFIEQEDFMDNATNITLKKLTINRNEKYFWFLKIRLPNLNTPSSVLKSTIIYLFWFLVDSDITLNTGCLKSVQIIYKERTILSPSEEVAIISGNVILY